jgi:ACR3 family arsenite efflux pump ArsB
MGIFERFLSLWVGLAIVAGVALGALFAAALRKPWRALSLPASTCRLPC